MTFEISHLALFVGQVGNLRRVVNPLGGIGKVAERRLATGAQDAILPHMETRDL
jgi:hypothetical protein